MIDFTVLEVFRPGVPVPCERGGLLPSPADDPWHDPSLFYLARHRCRTKCPVVMECLDYARRAEHGVSRQHRSGVWGGLTPEERADLDTAARMNEEAAQ
jgi:hypothetical protein